MKIAHIIMGSVLAVALAGCSTGTSNEPELPDIPVVEDSSEVETVSPKVEPVDKLAGIDNDPAVVEALVALNKATCDKAKQTGVTESDSEGLIQSFLIPEESRLFDIAGYYLIEGELYIENDVDAFSACSLAVLAETSEIAYGEPLAHISIEDRGDGKYFIGMPWLDSFELQEYVVEDGVISEVNILDMETEEFIYGKNLEYSVSEGDLQTYTQYLQDSVESSPSGIEP